MDYGELILPPAWTGRDAKTGRFLKGYVPANKGKRWDEFMGKRSQKRSARGWKNLELYRCRPDNAGRPKKMVVGVLADGTWKIFSYSVPAAEWCGGSRYNVMRCCRENALHGRNTDHQYKGVRFYFEGDPVWLNKIKI